MGERLGGEGIPLVPFDEGKETTTSAKKRVSKMTPAPLYGGRAGPGVGVAGVVEISSAPGPKGGLTPPDSMMVTICWQWLSEKNDVTSLPNKRAVRVPIHRTSVPTVRLSSSAAHGPSRHTSPGEGHVVHSGGDEEPEGDEPDAEEEEAEEVAVGVRRRQGFFITSVGSARRKKRHKFLNPF